METLKHSLRRMFDERNPMYLHSDNELEDGLLEKIINLSVLNPHVFSTPPCSIIAVKSPLYKQKLYYLLGNPEIIFNSAVVLVIVENYFYQSSAVRQAMNIIQLSTSAVSITYSAKHYGVNSYIINNTDFEGLEKELRIGPGKKIEMVICLGYFNTTDDKSALRRIAHYSDIVREI